MPGVEHAAHESHDLAHHRALKANVIMFIIVVILLLTLAFENGHHYLMHKYHHDKYVKRFVSAFYRVLTVLGLIGLSLFTLIYFGFAKFINDRVFGQSKVEMIAEHELREEGESINFAPTEFAEIVEDIQKSIFIAMCLYVIVGLGLTLCLRSQRRKWELYDKMSYANMRVYLANAKKSLSLVRYWSHKVRFLYPSSSLKYNTRYSPVDDAADTFDPAQPRTLNETPPLAPGSQSTLHADAHTSAHPDSSHKGSHHAAARLEPAMIFSRYLTICYSEVVTKIVRLSPSVWLAALATLGLGLPFYRDKIVITYIAIGTSLFIVALTCFMAEQMSVGVEQITVPLNAAREAILNSETQSQARMSMPQDILLDARDVVVRTDDRILAPFFKLVEGSSVRGSQDNLLMFGAIGKSYSIILFQVLLFIQVVVITFSFTRLLNPWWIRTLSGGLVEEDEMNTPNNIRAYSMLALPAVLCVLNISLFWPSLLNNFTLITSLEKMVNFELIDEIDTEIATQNLNDQDNLINTLYSLSVLNTADTSTLPNSGDLSDDQLFYALPSRLRTQLIGLHKEIVFRETRRSGNMNRGGCTGSEAAAILNVPSGFTRIFEHAAELGDQEFIRKILAVAYSSAASDDEQTRADHRRDVAARLFDQVDDNNDGFININDLERLVPECSRVVKQWWLTEFGNAASYSDRETFIEIFSADLAGVLRREAAVEAH